MRGRPKGSKNKNKGQNQTPPADKLLPEALKACQGWTIDPSTNQEAEILSEDGYDDRMVTKPLADTYRHVKTSMEKRLESQDQEINSVNAHKQLLSDVAILKIVEHTNEQLTAKALTATSLI